MASLSVSASVIRSCAVGTPLPAHRQQRVVHAFPTWHEEFRQDLARVDVPTLVIHGDDDRIVPFSVQDSEPPRSSKGLSWS